jgi:hypothetical protein
VYFSSSSQVSSCFTFYKKCSFSNNVAWCVFTFFPFLWLPPWTGISLNLYIALNSVDILAILSLPVHEHGIPFHLFLSFNLFQQHLWFQALLWMTKYLCVIVPLG